jgi:translocator protein
MTLAVNNAYYYGSLAGWILLLQAVGAFTGFFTRGDIRGWYKNIKRSPLTPPNYVFPIAWTTLYILIAIAGWKLQLAD